MRGSVIVVLKPDFQNTLRYFVYTNLPLLMNPDNARNIIVTNAIIPTTPTTPTTPITPISSAPISTIVSVSSTTDTTTTVTTSTTSTAPVLTITPEVLQALQSYTLNNFPDIGLPTDIQEITKIFLANIPPLVLITPTTATPITAAALSPITVTTVS